MFYLWSNFEDIYFFFLPILQKSNVLTETDKINISSNVKSPLGSSRKRKRRSIAGLAKVNLYSLSD